MRVVLMIDTGQERCALTQGLDHRVGQFEAQEMYRGGLGIVLALEVFVSNRIDAGEIGDLHVASILNTLELRKLNRTHGRIRKLNEQGHLPVAAIRNQRVIRLELLGNALRLKDSFSAQDLLHLGRSHDLMLGEPVIAIGDAAALPFTVSRGIVSGLGRATHTEHAFLPSVVQTDAAINGGNSGGPLINAVGEQIGVVTSRRDGADNVAFAITADRVRTVFAELLAVEERAGIRFGAELDALAERAVVTAVTANSPAADGGLVAGDVLTRIQGTPVRSAAAVALELLARRPGDTLQIGVLHGDTEREVTLELGAVPLAPAARVESSQPGLQWEVYEGAFDALPDFDALARADQGVCEVPSVDAHGGRRDDYALMFTGFVEVPTDGVWRFGATSDDGSRVWIDGRLVVDNDGLHGAVGKTGIRRLASGLHALRVEFFERQGDEVLTLHWSGPGQPWGEIPASAYRRQ